MTFPGIILAVSLLFSSPEAAKDVDIPHPGPHPRILLREKGEEGIRNAIGSRKVFAQADSVIVHYCDSILGEPPLERVMTGRRMLSVSREALRRIFYLSYSFRVHEDRRYLERAIEEMLKVSGFSSWNPSHFLDTGEMTMALAIGYDWLFYEMTPSQRETVSKAMLEKGFLPSKDEEGCAWFYSSPLNWNQVCNAGLTYGAIALWDDYPAESERIVRRCLESNPLSMKSYSPEGGYEEGYGYWGYGSTFEIMLISALESAFGSDLGLVDSEGGFLRSGRFIQMMTTPSGGCFNYGDCSPEASVQYALGWMAKRIHDPSLLYNELRIVERKGFDSIIEPRLFPLFLIYGSALDLNAVTPPEGNFYQCSGGAPLFIYREGWEDEGDAYLGIKAGMASSSHGHVDVSSFIFEEEGVRWAADIGGEDYQRIEGSGVDLWDNKQYSPRWRIFRLGPICHNILTVNGQIPDVDVSLDFSRSWKCPVKKGCRNIHFPSVYE